MTRTFASLLASSVLLPGFSYSASFDWPNWRGPHHDGISRDTGWSSTWPPDGPRTLWKASVDTGFSSDTVYCFDAGSGREIWKHSYPCTLDAKGDLVCLDVRGKAVAGVGR